jgi:hypothetical protein
MAKKNPRPRPSRAAATPKATPATARELGATLGLTIRGAAPDIVSALIEQAKAGNSTPAKFLFEFAGLCSAAAPDPAAEESLAALLLRELQRYEPGAGNVPPGTVQ